MPNEQPVVNGSEGLSPNSPIVGYDRVAAVVDASTLVGSAALSFALGNLQREATENQDVMLEAAVRVEGIISVAFSSLEEWERAAPAIQEMLTPDDIPYLRQRSTTSNHRLRAQYLHAIACITRRADDGRSAAEVYLDAISAYLLQPVQGNFEAFHALNRYFPIAARLSMRYGLADRFRQQAIAFLNDSDPYYGDAKARFFIWLMSQRKVFDRDAFQAIQDRALALPEVIAGNDYGLIIAVGKALERLQNRLGEDPALAWAAEARGLEERISMTPEPMLVQLVGARLLYLYNRLKNDPARLAVEAKMNEARGHQTIYEISGQPEGWSEHVEMLRARSIAIIQDVGPMGLLLTIATDPSLVPKIQEVNEQVQRLAAEGVGVFRQFAQVIVSSGQRIVGHESQEFDEQYDILWSFGSVAPAAILIGEAIQNGELDVSHFEQFLRSSWINRDENVSYGGTERMPNDLVSLLLAPLRLYIGVLSNEFTRDLMVPALDSLVIRFEAVLRKLARLNGRPDSETGDDGITHYHGLRRLLGDEALVAILGEDLAKMVHHTLMREPEGLRDRVGHAILHFNEYHLRNLDAAILLLLRLVVVKVNDTDSPQLDAQPHPT